MAQSNNLSKHFSGHSRPCPECKQRLPTHPKKKNEYTLLPELMDPENPGIYHWTVCPAKHTPEQIEQNKKDFYSGRVKWKKDNGYNVTPTDYAKAGMPIPAESEEEDEEVEEQATTSQGKIITDVDKTLQEKLVQLEILVKEINSLYRQKSI